MQRGCVIGAQKNIVLIHRCKGKQIFMIDVGVDNQTEEEAEDTTKVIMEENSEISIHAITGILGCSTMKVEG